MTGAAFTEASRFFTAVVGEAAAHGWDRPGLGEWTLLELVAHGNRGNTLVVEYLTRPVAPASPEYFTDEAITARARQAVADLGDDPVGAVTASSAAAIAAVEAAPADATIGAPVGTMPLAEYLPSRVAELLIHGLDVARAGDLAFVEPPAEALAVALHFLTDHAVRTGNGVTLVLALAGRQSLPGDFSLY